MIARFSRPTALLRKLALTAVLPMLAPLSATAQSFNIQPANALPTSLIDLRAIDNAVASFIGSPVGTPGGANPVDRRLRLVQCAGALTVNWRGDSHKSVMVQCTDPGSWRIFVPVGDGAPAPGASEAAGPGIINKGDSVTVAVTGDGFTVSQPGEALEGGPAGGWIRVRTIAKGEPLRARIIRPGLVEFTVE